MHNPDSARPIVSVAPEADPTFWMGLMLAPLAAQSTVVEVRINDDADDDLRDASPIWLGLTAVPWPYAVMKGVLMEGNHPALGSRGDDVSIETHYIDSITIL